MKRQSAIRECLEFDDVLLVPAETFVKPADVQTKTRLTKAISLGIPLISAGRANVTESAMAIAIAQMGGIGVIHDNMPIGKQVEEVRRVKRSEGEVIDHPITTSPEASIAEVLDLMRNYKVSGLPVVDAAQKVVGMVTVRDVRFFTDMSSTVSAVMSKNVVTVKRGVDRDMARKLLHRHRIEKLVVVDDQGRCVGLITVKDIEKLSLYPHASRGLGGCLRVGAAVGTGKDALDRTAAMTDAGLDVVFVDVAHAHTRDAVGTVSIIRQQRTSEVQIVAGNVATPEAASRLIDAGADAIKVGVGLPGAQSRGFAGVGLPQLSAVLAVAEQCAMQDIPVIVDGVGCPAVLAKAIAAGAECAAVSCLFAGTDEAPGDVVYRDGQPCKVIQANGNAHGDPYALEPVASPAPYRGSVEHAVHYLTDGLKTAMAYTGSKDIATMRNNAELVRAK